jgi:competence protein ComEC
VLTHYDMDHVGGVDAVIGHVGAALVGTVSDLGGEHIVDRIRAGGASVTFARAGQTGALGGSAQTDAAQVNNAWVWTVLWPDGTTPHMQEGNPGSVAMYWQLGSLSAVFLADLGADAQNIIRSRYHQLAHIDVLKVAHHGSADTSPELTSQLHPRIALIGVGADNGYGHPTRSALASLTSVGAIIARTDTQGMLFVSPAGVDIFTLSTER